ncbi:MAG: sigma-70 family RNA polymerase sigma factor [Deltaproteobacteria bacterium]|nr:sigma-70 family RNA polymerase sigma factor [Deltaproteobacteria bacterium]
MATDMGHITPLLKAWEEGDQEAFHELFGRTQRCLHRLARGYFVREKPNHTLQPTALIHEVYLRLDRRQVEGIKKRSHFFAHVARLMREILVDHARRRLALKRGGHLVLEQLTQGHEALAVEADDAADILAVDQALGKLEHLNPAWRKIVELRYFSGFSMKDIAAIQGVSLATVERSWSAARRWLARELARSS